MDPESKEYKLLADTLETLHEHLQFPWGSRMLGRKTKKHTTRTTDGLIEQLRPHLTETYISWLTENMHMIQKLVNQDWEGRGKHTTDLQKIRNIINHTKLVFDNTSKVFGPCKRF